MALNIPPSPGPGEAPLFEKRMGELRDQLEQRRGPRQRKREHAASLEECGGAELSAAGEDLATSSRHASSDFPPCMQEEPAQSPACETVQPEPWEEPYVRPPRKRPKRRKPERDPVAVPLGGSRLVILCSAVSALVSAGVCLALGAGDASALGTALSAAGWSL